MASLGAMTALLGGLLAVPTPLRLTADVEDVYALRANPSALGFLDGFELRLVYGRADQDLYQPASSGATNGFGLFAAVPLWRGFVVGGSVEADVDGDERTAPHYQLGFGWASRRLALGLAYENDPVFTGESKGMVDFGFSLRLASWLATGLTIQDLAQHAQRREWQIGLAVRPHERFTFSAQWGLTQSEALTSDTLDLLFLANVEPIDGLLIGVGADDDLTMYFNLGLRFGGLGLGGAVTGVRGEPAVVAEVVYDAEPGPSLVEPSAIAVVELAGDLTPDPSFSIFSGIVLHSYGAAPLELEALRTSDQVEGVFVRVGSLDIGWAKAVEIRRALLAIKDTGRRIDCQLLGRGDLPYFIATACDDIIIAPPQMLEVNGIAADVLFFGEALDRLGVHVEVVRRGEYKSSPEQLTRSGMSRAQREALGAYVDTVFDTLVDGIAEGRKLERDQVTKLIDQGTFTSSEAVSAKLVDRQLYPDEIEDHLREKYGFVRFISASRLLPEHRARWARRAGIAIIHVDATITSGESTNLPFGFGRTAGAQTIIQAIEAAQNRSDVRAVVLRVDSPGGDAVASDLIARAVAKLAEKKPVIASFGDVAASGGYYVAANARTIYAEPTTLTGSIGVFSASFSFEELLANLGIHASVVGRGEHANASSSFFRPDEGARALIEKGVDDAYRMFLEVVANGRKMDEEKVRAVAEGRIWSGRDAKAKGLVDDIGGLYDAVRAAKLAAGFDPDEPIAVVTLPSDRAPLPEPVRTVVGALAPGASPGTSVQDLIPPDIRDAVGEVYAPYASSREGTALALSPWRIRVR